MVITQTSEKRDPAPSPPRGRSAEDLEKALLSIRQARDTVLARNLELTGKLAAAEDRISELEDEREAADHARDAALQLVKDLSETSDDLRRKAQVLDEENSKLQQAKRDADYALEVARKAHTEAPSASELDDARRRAEDIEASGALIKMQLEKTIASLTAQLAAAARARDIAVGAVMNAQRQIDHLSSERKALRAQIDADNSAFEARLAHIEARLPSHEKSTAPASEPETIFPVSSADCALPGEDANAAVAAMRACVESLAAEPENRELLDELDERFHGHAATAGGAGRPAIARLSSGCGELTRWLRKTPRKIPDMLDRLREAVSLLADLSTGAAQLDDPAGAVVYSVDDDGENCECIAMSLEKMALRTRYSVKPEVALADLTAAPCDLIILDVDLGSTDGFELSERIRAIAHHRETPVIFLSGLMSAKARLDTLSGGSTTFVAKPYNLNELGVIALTMILKARLDSASVAMAK